MKATLTPSSIRAIRLRLGLTQEAAGKLLGGGAKAFSKYESGTVKPAAMAVNLLRLLDARPELLSLLSGDAHPPSNDGRAPRDRALFEVTGYQVTQVAREGFSDFFRRLLVAEVSAHGLPATSVHVAEPTNNPDGGEDARVEWRGGPAQTTELPGRLVQFQLKSGHLRVADAGREVIAKDGRVKPMIHRVLSGGGCYVMVCAQGFTQSEKAARLGRIRESLSQAGSLTTDTQLAFLDADQLATWVNRHPPVVAWVLERVQPGLLGPFRAWPHWVHRFPQPWIEDERITEVRHLVRRVGATEGQIGRLVGPAGIGKSRLAHEALKPLDECRDQDMTALLLYASAVHDSTHDSLVRSAQNFAGRDDRLLLVVDDCPQSLHRRLRDIVSVERSRLSLITLAREDESASGADSLTIERSADAVMDGMVRYAAPALRDDDRWLLVRQSQGYPLMAHLLASAWHVGAPTEPVVDDEWVRQVVFGAKEEPGSALMEAAMLLGAFRLLDIENDGDLETLASALTLQNSPSSLRSAWDTLLRKGVVRRYGSLASIQPRPLAAALAQWQWRAWSPQQWDTVLTGLGRRRLQSEAANQLASLSETTVARDVARHVLRFGGELRRRSRLSSEGGVEVVSALAEIEPAAALDLIESWVETVKSSPSLFEPDDLNASEVKGQLVSALQKIAFHSSCFERAACSLLSLATSNPVDQLDDSPQRAARAFESLFSPLGSNTTAEGPARLQLLGNLVEGRDLAQLPILIDALHQATTRQPRYLLVGPGLQGSRPALSPWLPATKQELLFYVCRCTEMLIGLGLGDQQSGKQARDRLAWNLRDLIRYGLVDEVESWVKRLVQFSAYWQEGLEALNDALKYDAVGMAEATVHRLRILAKELEPRSFADRVRLLVLRMPWDFPLDEDLPYEAIRQKQLDALQDLAAEAVRNPDQLLDVLPGLMRDLPRMAAMFGQAIATHEPVAGSWAIAFTDCFVAIESTRRNADLLAGYFAGLLTREPAMVEAFKKRSAGDDVFGPVVLELCGYQERITTDDVSLVLSGLAAGTIPPRSIGVWAYGGRIHRLASADLERLADALFSTHDGFSTAVDLLGMSVHGHPERLDSLRPLLIRMATLLAGQKAQGSPLDAHLFAQMMTWLLRQGPTDVDAQTVARTLTTALLSHPEHAAFVTPLLPVMLSDFGHIVWPPIGRHLLDDKASTSGLKRLLRDGHRFTPDGSRPAIDFAPEEILFTWAHGAPESAAATLAEIIPLWARAEAGDESPAFHPKVDRLLNEFGHLPEVQCALERNMNPFAWAGSLADSFERFDAPLNRLKDHERLKVRLWAAKMLTRMNEQKRRAMIIGDSEERASSQA